MSMKSNPSPARSSSAESYQRARGSRAAASARCAGRVSVTATISTSRRSSQPGRWPWTATLPSPMMAPRRILGHSFAMTASVEPVPGEHGGERLFEDAEPLERSVLGDDEGRVDPDGGRVRHGDEAAPEALLVERLRHLLRGRLLRQAVPDELDAQHQAP